MRNELAVGAAHQTTVGQLPKPLTGFRGRNEKGGMGKGKREEKEGEDPTKFGNKSMPMATVHI